MDFRSEATYKETRLPVELASTLLPEAYRSAEYFVEEQAQLFARSWVPVAARPEVAMPGQTIVRTVAGRSIILTMNQEGEVRAYLNVCRHRGSRLVREDCTLKAGRFRCPYHAWAYDLDGNCIGTPLFEGSNIPEDMRAAFDMSDVRAFDRADYPLFPVLTRTWGPLIMVSLDPDVMSLEEWMGDLGDRLAGYSMDDWEIQARKDYDIAANWKLVAENFMEYYHLPWVHPELAKVSRIKDHYRYQGPGMYTGMTTTPISGDGPAWMALPPHDGVRGANLNAGRFMLAFPNAAISVLPNHCFLMLMDPVSHDRTYERCFILTHPSSMGNDGAEVALESLLGFWDEVNREDIEIVENVQLGLSTPEYEGGRMCYRFEEPVHRFQNMVIDRMVGLDRVPDGDNEDKVPMFGD
ncbi:MAG: aromatic ring-hydroxylating dioxygenase subunit alpha [Acidimicrobiia bacterium]|jgi:phenylpropionate dioxygenase-like ring-hydroxylating dioxygenase large terminal subunit